MKNPFTFFWMLVAFIALISPASAADPNPQPKAKAAKEAPVPVKALQVQPLSKTFVRQLPATLMTTVETHLAFRVSGRIAQLPVTVGQMIKKGNRVAILDPKDFEDSEGQSEAALAQAVAREKDADLHLSRMQKLWANQDIDISQLDKARADARAAEDQVKIQKKQLNEARRRLSYTQLKAPFTGIVAQKNVSLFDTVSAGQAIVHFVDLSRLKARAQLSPSLLPESNRFLTYTLVIPSLNGLRIPAKLEGVGPSALPRANTYPITVIFRTERHTDLRPGMNGLLEIAVERRVSEQFIQIPVDAVDSDTKGNPAVWVVDTKKGVVQPRPVSTGGLTQNGIEIKKGLRGGEWVVTAGLRNLRPGQRVTILK